MKEELKLILTKSQAQKKLNLDFLKRAKKTQRKKLDLSFRIQHDRVFENIDCLDCGNCCKTTSPVFTNHDIKRLASFFKIKIIDFINEYLIIDDDDDYVLKSTPCPFLGEDNACFIYDKRPIACREYPHTNRKNMQGILKLTGRNAEICPAVAKILKNLRVK